MAPLIYFGSLLERLSDDGSSFPTISCSGCQAPTRLFKDVPGCVCCEHKALFVSAYDIYTASPCFTARKERVLGRLVENMAANEEFWLVEVLFSDLVLCHLFEMLFEYAKDCYIWGDLDAAYSAITFAKKINDKLELALIQDEQALQRVLENQQNFLRISVAIYSQTDKREECMACFSKLVQYEEESGEPGIGTQVLAQIRRCGSNPNNNDELVTFLVLKSALEGIVQGPEGKAHNRKTHCATCGKESNELDRCSKCQSVYYCGRKCQKLDWKEHKAECKASKRS